MVKFVVSCCVVSKQVEVPTILVSVESTGSWLPLSANCVSSSSGDIAQYCLNLPIYTAHALTLATCSYALLFE